MNSCIHIGTLPAIKMILHASKHPHAAVSGLLLCSNDDSLGEIVDYIPLFHCATTLSPMLETALYQVESYCSREGLRICGYFQANEHIDDNRPTGFAMRIVEKIKAKCGPACLIVLQNDQLQALDNEYFVGYTSCQSKWQECNFTVDDDVSDRLPVYISSKLHRLICDFDDHLNDIKNDYLNRSISKSIQLNTV